MKLLSFNINGLRARPHQIAAIIEKHAPDVIGLQETKVHDDAFPLDIMSDLGYHVHYHGQKAHYGVAMMTKCEPLAVRKGFPHDNEEAQRRLIAVDLPTEQGILTVINGYFPQGESNDHPIKYPAKRQFYADLMRYLQDDHSHADFIAVMGDMNISPTDNDIGITPDSQKRWLRTGKCSFLPEEREWMSALLNLGFTDSFRAQNPDCNDQYSWFDYRSRGFDSNTGLRIDLILANQKLMSQCRETGIDYEIRAMEKPSDHAPIWATFDLKSRT